MTTRLLVTGGCGFIGSNFVRLVLRERPGAALHFRAALVHNPRAVAHLAARFRTLRAALSARIAAKRAWIEASGAEPTFALPPRCLDVVAGAAGPTPFGPATRTAPQTSVSYTIKLG